MPARILIVEDNQTNLDLMTFLLKSFGHIPLSARDGAAGLELAQREQPDLIICDIQMPTIDGYEVARQLKNDPKLRQVPLIAVTALAMVGDRDKVLTAGFNGYIAKPIAPRTFVKEVESYLKLEPQSSPTLAKQTPVTPSPAPKCASILVMDNSPANLTLTCSILEPLGYKLIAADNMAEGLRLARQAAPDLILSDLNIPGGSGLSFLKAVKVDPQLKRIPFIFIASTSYLESDRQTSLALGAAGFIRWPIKPMALLAELELYLRAREVREAQKGDHDE